MALQPSTDIQETDYEIPQHDGREIEMSHIAGNIYDTLEGRDRDSHLYSTTREAVATVKTGTHNVQNKVQSNASVKRTTFSRQKFELTMCQLAVAMVFVCTVICTISGSIVYSMVNARIVEIERYTPLNHKAVEEKQSDIDRRLVAVESKQNTSETSLPKYQTIIDQRLSALDSVIQTVRAKQNTSELDSLDSQANVDRRLSALNSVVQTVQQKHNTSELASLEYQANIDRRLATLDSAVDTVQETVETVQEKQNSSGQQVAFTAHSATGKAVDSVLTFTNVDLNVGDGYNQITGRFRCPVAGTYLFSAKLTTIGTRVSTTYCYIRKNAVKSAIVYSNIAKYDVVSAAVLLHLSVGDLVDLGGCHSVSEIFTVNWQTSFIGCLIQAN